MEDKSQPKRLFVITKPFGSRVCVLQNHGVAQRNVIKISIFPAAKTVIEKVSEELGMKEIAVASRIYEWFGKQDDVVQKGVLGLLPKGQEQHVVELALSQLAAASKSKK